MIGQPKPLASLSSTLLARKGTARPAMRPQGFGGFGSLPGAHDDLGWNDMGEPHEAHGHDVPAAMPPVLMQREALQEEFAASPAAPEPEPVAEYTEELPSIEQVLAVKPVRAVEAVAVSAPVATTAPVTLAPARAERIARETKTTKAAFTLRLDHDRHLHLRLASALKNRSAQQLVTEALDAFLNTVPEVAELASQLPQRAGR